MHQGEGGDLASAPAWVPFPPDSAPGGRRLWAPHRACRLTSCIMNSPCYLHVSLSDNAVSYARKPLMCWSPLKHLCFGILNRSLRRALETIPSTASQGLGDYCRAQMGPGRPDRVLAVRGSGGKSLNLPEPHHANRSYYLSRRLLHAMGTADRWPA